MMESGSGLYLDKFSRLAIYRMMKKSENQSWMNMVINFYGKNSIWAG